MAVSTADGGGVYSAQDDATGEAILVIDDPYIEALAAKVARLRDLPVELALEQALELDVQRIEAERSAVTAG